MHDRPIARPGVLGSAAVEMAAGAAAGAASAAAVLEARGLTKRFGDFTAVNSVSFTLHEGEMLAIIGPNGAGKSTLFDLLTGRKAPDAGQVLLLGEDVSALPPWRRVSRGLGRSFQVSSVFPSLTALENVQVGMLIAGRHTRRLWGRAAARYRAEAEELLAAVGLSEQRDRRAGILSHGDQRLLELAVTLSTQPRILLLDEPTAGMGVEETERCMDRITAIAQQRRMPVVFVEHDMKVVFSFASRVAVLVQGSILIDGTPEQVRADERVKEAYFGEAL